MDHNSHNIAILDEVKHSKKASKNHNHRILQYYMKSNKWKENRINLYVMCIYLCTHTQSHDSGCLPVFMLMMHDITINNLRIIAG